MDQPRRNRLGARHEPSLALNHPHVATVYGLEFWKGRPVIALEFFKGGTLKERIARGLPSFSECQSISVGIASGLSYLHEQDLAHGDLKPANIGLTTRGQARLLDLGVARTRANTASNWNPPGQDADASVSQGLNGGTLAYLPPEAWGSGVIDPFACDLWGLALTLLVSASGQHPALGQRSGTVTLGSLLNTPWPPPIQRRPGFPPRLYELLEAGLDQEASRRIGSADVWERELASL